MYGLHLHQLLERKQRAEDEREKDLQRQLLRHKERTEQLKNRYWSRVENFMYNVN